MDSSTSPEHETSSSESLSTVAAQTEAIDRLIALAHQRIRVFDHDLSQTGWNRPARTDGLAGFLRAGRGRRIDIIVHDVRYVSEACPRLTSLLQRYSHAVTIYRTGAEARHATDPLFIVDDRHFLHRFHFEQPRAALGLHQPEETRLLSNRFDEIWATGEPGVNATQLGL
jgi:hypothetical protein